EAFNADAALHAGPDFVDVVLEAAQGLDDALVDQALSAENAGFAANQAAVVDDAAGDVAAFGQLEDFADLGRADDDLFDDRFQQAGHGFLDLVDQFVNDRVELDLNPFPFGQVGHTDINAGVETQNDGGGGGGEQDIRFGDGAHGAVNDFEGNLFGLDLLESLDNRLDGALGVGFDDHLQDFGLGGVQG